MAKNSNESTHSTTHTRMSSLNLETRLEDGDFLAIHTDPTGFVVDQLTQRYNSRQITEKMVLAGLDSTDAAILVQETEVWCTAVVKEQRRKGGRANLLAGGAFLGELYRCVHFRLTHHPIWCTIRS